MTFPGNLLIGSVGLLLLGLWQGWYRRHASGTERLAAILLPLLLGALMLAYYETALLNTRWPWSACRLAPSIALLHGYPLYSPVDSGPINGWLYGPVAAILWTPAAFADSPRPALLIAAVINLLFLLGPLLAAGRRAAPGARLPGLLAFACGGAGLLQFYPTWYMASALNADAIAVGLGAGSCLLLLGAGPPAGKRLLLAAVLSVLAVWTKQNEAPLVLAQCGWLWFRHDRRTALQFTVAYTGAMLAMAALIFGLMGTRDVIFNMWTVPSAHAISGGWAAGRAEFFDFFRYTAILWLLCLLGWWWPARIARTGGEPAPSGRVHPVLLFLAAAVVLLPLGIMASLKVGGDRNSIHSVYYLVIAATLTLAHAWPAATARSAAMLRGAILFLAATSVGLGVRQVAGYPDLTVLPRRCLSEEAWHFARQHPGRVYFPWDPLATLMADGRMYHFEYGVIDRVYAGRAPAADRLKQSLPAQLDVVVYPRADYSMTMLQRYLPQYGFATATEDWLVFRKISAEVPAGNSSLVPLAPAIRP